MFISTNKYPDIRLHRDIARLYREILNSSSNLFFFVCFLDFFVIFIFFSLSIGSHLFFRGLFTRVSCILCCPIDVEWSWKNRAGHFFLTRLKTVSWLKAWRFVFHPYHNPFLNYKYIVYIVIHNFYKFLFASPQGYRHLIITAPCNNKPTGFITGGLYVLIYN